MTRFIRFSGILAAVCLCLSVPRLDAEVAVDTSKVQLGNTSKPVDPAVSPSGIPNCYRAAPATRGKQVTPANKPPQCSGVCPCVADKPPEGMLLSKEFVSLGQTALSAFGLLFSVLAVVFGAIVGVNVYQGSSTLTDAKKELEEVRAELLELRKAKQDYEHGLKELTSTADKIRLETVAAIKKEAATYVQDMARDAHRRNTLSEYVREANALLASSTPDEAALFPKVTAMFGYVDAEIGAIYRKCIEVLPKDSQLLAKVLQHGMADAFNK